MENKEIKLICLDKESLEPLCQKIYNISNMEDRVRKIILKPGILDFEGRYDLYRAGFRGFSFRLGDSLLGYKEINSVGFNHMWGSTNMTISPNSPAHIGIYRHKKGTKMLQDKNCDLLVEITSSRICDPCYHEDHNYKVVNGDWLRMDSILFPKNLYENLDHLNNILLRQNERDKNEQRIQYDHNIKSVFEDDDVWFLNRFS